jgi:hypothetical protein
MKALFEPAAPATAPTAVPAPAPAAHATDWFVWACPCCRATLRTLSTARRGSCPACGSFIEAPEPPAATAVAPAPVAPAEAGTAPEAPAASPRKRPLWPALAIGGLALAAAAAAFLLIRAQPWQQVFGLGAASGDSRPPSAEQLRRQLDQFLQAPGWAAKSPLVLDAARLDMMGTAYYQGRDPDTIRAADFQPWSLPGLSSLAGVTVLRAERPGRRPIVAAFRQSGRGWHLDWELFTQTYDEALANFLSSPSYPIRTFRTRLHRVFPDNAPENTYCVQVSDPFDPGQRITVDLPMGTPIMNAVASGLPGTTPREATVEVCWARPQPEGAWVPMLQKLVCWGWLGLNGSPEPGTPAAPANDRFLTPAAAPIGSPPPPAESTLASATVASRP